MFPGKTIVLKAGAHIGHGAIVHGANIGKNCLVGMNAVLMDDADLGDESIVGALAFVKAGMKIPPRSLLVGNPAEIIRTVSDEMLDWKTKGTQLYQKLPADCFESLKAVDPLRELPLNRPSQEELYQTLKEFLGNQG
jgi:carbonic anhydrase/acetyltransferase-like protein (isoleucine patch superfamily)